MTALMLAGFTHAVVVYLQKSRWWVNPILQTPERGSENSTTMSVHLVLKLMWIAVAIVQYVVTMLIVVHI